MDLNVKSKIWIEIEGLPFLGKGRRDLLKRIEQTGSLSEAARQLGISYKKAWSYLHNMEERVGIKLVEKHVGGKGGGGAILTQEGKKLIAKFDQLMDGNQDNIDHKFEGIF